ncbi:MAG: hypothetical protein Athens101428_164 [Candidatus Berkelbacteria bacterium Athens1014_28]|uniref:PPC domain-containing protein n=1 Tax=Candidatus Berkelbacteria bacterium Athens1014_28 TaxID=2017145 RepID=A0A554LPN2_9BACT|nr:MAG: hypothetical protein Athens101428_164 [Candidatus Berkelbacteria bacterium Athens1014_28]
MKDIKIIRLKKDDDVILGIINFCQKNKITYGWFTGLGAVENAEISIYDLNSKSYINKKLQGPLEIANLCGNVAKKDDQIVIHCHTTLSDKNFATYAGHLNKAKVGATCEIVFLPITTKLKRKYNEEIGLNLLEI